jgi:glycosyltransferase involved in cell wall biosynthesis
VRLLQAVGDGRPGGGTTHVLQLIEQLRQDWPGDIHLVSQSGSYALDRATALGIEGHGLDFMEGGRFNLHTWRGLRRLVQELEPGLIHAHGARAALPITAARAGSGPALVYSVHGYHFPAKAGGVRALAMLAERWCSVRAEATVFVCEHDRMLAERFGILGRCRHHRVIRNGIVTEGLPRKGTDADGPLVFAGRLVEQKNPLILVEVLSQLREAGVRLLVIGDGPLAGAMRERARALGVLDRIELCGALAHEAALEALARGAVLLLPSLWEGLPIVLLEAMAIGVPVVASAVGGVPEVVEHGATGLLVEGQAPEGYAKAVRRLLHEPGLHARIAADARRLVAERFSWAAVRQAYLETYRDALQARGGSTTGG